MSLQLFLSLGSVAAVPTHNTSKHQIFYLLKPLHTTPVMSGNDVRGCKTYGGGKRTAQRTLQKISGTLEKSVWSGKSLTFYKEKLEQRHQMELENVPNEGGGGVQNRLLEGVSFFMFSSPLFFPPTPPQAIL